MRIYTCLTQIIFNMVKSEKRGGTRTGSGAKPKYNEKTQTFGVRCPSSKINELKSIIKSKLSEWTITLFLAFLLSSCHVANFIATEPTGKVIETEKDLVLVMFPVIIGPEKSKTFNWFYQPGHKYQDGDMWP